MRNEHGESYIMFVAIVIGVACVIALFSFLQSWIYNTKEDKVKRYRQKRIEEIRSHQEVKRGLPSRVLTFD